MKIETLIISNTSRSDIIKANVSFNLDGVKLKGFKIVKGQYGHFLRFPDNISVTTSRQTAMQNLALQEYTKELCSLGIKKPA